MKINSILLIAITVLSASAFAGVKLKYDFDGFMKACLASSNLSRPVCECTAKKAAKELSPTGFDFLVATLKKDKEKSLALRRKLEQTELLTAGMFMSRGPDLCAKELGLEDKK